MSKQQLTTMTEAAAKKKEMMSDDDDDDDEEEKGFAAISMAHEVRGMYAHEDEAAPYLRQGWPRFDTKEECEAFVKKCWRAGSSNPDRPHMTQMITTLVNWTQVERYILGARAEYDLRWPPRAVDGDAFETTHTNVWTTGVSLDADDEDEELVEEDRAKSYVATEELEKRLSVPVHASLTPFSVETTLRYLFDHMRCGIYVMLRQNKVCIFAPFVNENYRNHWGDRLRVEEDLDTVAYYAKKKEIQGGRREYVLEDRHDWWANGNIVCNEHSQTGKPVEESNLWGDRFIAALRDMLDVACSERTMADCEFFINKRDYPQIKYREEEIFSEDELWPPGQVVEPYGFLIDGDDRDPEDDVALPREFRHVSMAPVVSFYCSDRFTDLPWPPSEDWEAAV